MPAKKRTARKSAARKTAKKRTATGKSVETLVHDKAKRKNIPTAEHQSVLEDEQKAPKSLRYPRNTDLDPQLVWRGKDEQDWSDLLTHLFHTATATFQEAFRTRLALPDGRIGAGHTPREST